MPEGIVHLGELVQNCDVPVHYGTIYVWVSYLTPSLHWETCQGPMNILTNFAIYDWGHIATAQRLGCRYVAGGEQPVLPEDAILQGECSYPRWYTFIIQDSVVNPQPAPQFSDFRIWSAGASALQCQVGNIIKQRTMPSPHLNLNGDILHWHAGTLVLEIPGPSNASLLRAVDIPSPLDRQAKYLHIPTIPAIATSTWYPQITQGFALQWRSGSSQRPGSYRNEMIFYSFDSH